MQLTDNEIQEKYLQKAIRELNQVAQDLLDEDGSDGKQLPVLGSGHPQADIFLIKMMPGPAELEEGVAFYGRCGAALMKAFKRLQIDPMNVYGTVCVKCPGREHYDFPRKVREELAIVDPRMIVVMGNPALTFVNGLDLPMARKIQPQLGRLQRVSDLLEVIYTPDIDESLDDQQSKVRFWNAFRPLGDWYLQHPPY